MDAAVLVAIPLVVFVLALVAYLGYQHDKAKGPLPDGYDDWGMARGE